jgi:hypothetical protein
VDKPVGVPVPPAGAPDPDTPVGRLLLELERIAGTADTARAAADRAEIVQLRREVAELRAAVAYLRAGTAPLPGRLRPVVARAMLATGPTTGAGGPGA